MSGSFLVSPGILVREIDNTDVIGAVATSPGATAGYFEWGAVMLPQSINSENTLVSVFGKPTDATYNSFFTAANFLAYTNNLLVTRANSQFAFNAGSYATDTSAANAVSSVVNSTAVTGTGFTSGMVGQYIQVAGGIVGQVASFQSATAITLVSGAALTTSAIPYSAVNRVIVKNGIEYAANTVSLTNAGAFIAQYPGAKGNSLTVSIADAGTFSKSLVASTSINSTYNVNLVSLVRATNVVTVTSTTPHNLAANQSVTISNSGTFNGSFAVAAITSATVFTITVGISGADETATSIGSINSNQVVGVGTTFTTDFVVGSWIADGSGNIIGQVGSINSALILTLTANALVNYSGTVYFSKWQYYGLFNSAPATSSFASNQAGSNDELHIVVVDSGGQFTGVAGSLLESYPYLSKASNALSSDGTSKYYKNVLRDKSQYVLMANQPTGTTNWGSLAASVAFTSLATINSTYALTYGSVGNGSTDSDLETAFALYSNAEEFDIALIPTGKASTTLANFVIALADTRKDCVAFISPQDVSTGAPIVGADTAHETAILTYANAITSSSYFVFDSGYKYQYDRYNDTYRYVPLNGDIAGVCARTDYTNDPWWSPAGYSRGQIKNVVKLAFNPNQTNRDNLFKARVNPVVSFPGQGTILFGDKTGLAKSSAFDAIGVRRLFIILEKAIATASKQKLFEFNDDFTRSQFRAMVEPFLRDVQGRRGITEFLVVCDATNNTPDIIDTNNFVASIYIKPNRSIRYITLNFIATRSGISFSEVGA